MRGRRVKLSAYSTLKYFPYFSLSFNNSFSFEKNKEIIMDLSSAEYFQRVVMVKDKPYLCM